MILIDLAIQTSFHAEVLDCLIWNPMAWLLSFAMEKVIRFFHPSHLVPNVNNLFDGLRAHLCPGIFCVFSGAEI